MASTESTGSRSRPRRPPIELSPEKTRLSVPKGGGVLVRSQALLELAIWAR